MEDASLWCSPSGGKSLPRGHRSPMPYQSSAAVPTPRRGCLGAEGSLFPGRPPPSVFPMAHRSVTGISCRVAGRHGAPGTLLGLLLSVLLPVVAWGFPSFEPFTDVTASGGTAYTAGSGLYHQTNALGESWSLWNGGSGGLAAQVMCVNSNLAYAGFPTGFPAPPASLAVSLPGTAAGVSGYSAALQLSQAVAADPNNLTTNKVYASFLLAVPSLGNLTSSSPIYFGGFATNAGDQSVSLPSRAMKFFLKGNSATSGSSTSYAIGIQNASAAGTSAAYY